MGTHAYEIVCYRGRYYRFFHHYDGNAGHLGNAIVKRIPSVPEEYAAWLARMKAKFQEQHEDLETFLAMKAYKGQILRENWRTRYRSPGAEYGWEDLPSYEPMNQMIEWSYIVDLDRETFTVGESAHLKLNCIPKDAMFSGLTHDVNSNLMFITTGESLADLVRPQEPKSKGILRRYHDLHACVVTAKISGPSACQGRVSLLSHQLLDLFHRRYKDSLNGLLPGWTRNDFLFRELVYAILCIATAGTNVSFWRPSRVLDSSEDGYSDLLEYSSGETPKYTYHHIHHYDSDLGGVYDGQSDGGVQSKDATNIKAQRDHSAVTPSMLHCRTSSGPEFVAHLGVGSHLKMLPPGSSPEGSVYWFEGALVMLTEELQRDGAIERNMLVLVDHCRIHYPNTFINAILISIRDVVLVKISPSGQIEHTELLPLFDLNSTLCKSSADRYPALYLEAHRERVRNHDARKDAITERHAEETQAMTDASMRPVPGLNDPEDIVDRSQKTKEERESELQSQHYKERCKLQDEAQMEKSDINHNFKKEVQHFANFTHKPLAPGFIKRSFLALTCFFEVAARQNLPASPCRVPREVLHHILRYTDLETWRACMDVSTIFRSLCQAEDRLHEDFAILAPCPRSSSDHSDRALDQNEDEAIKEDEFRKMDLPSGRRTRVTLKKALSGKLGKDAFQIVLGNQHHRRSLLPGLVSLEPLDSI